MAKVFFAIIALAISVFPWIAEASGREIPRIGVLTPGGVERYEKALIEGLRQQGYVDGVTATILFRQVDEAFKTGPRLAEELVSLDPDVVFAAPGILAKHVSVAAQKINKAIPIVVYTDDPVEEGLVASAPRPGGNITGIGDAQDPQLVTKLLQLLVELLPRLSRVAYLSEPVSGPGKQRIEQYALALKTAASRWVLQLSQ